MGFVVSESDLLELSRELSHIRKLRTRMRIGASGAFASSSRTLVRSDSIDGFRKYHCGDLVRSIHWPSLLIKQTPELRQYSVRAERKLHVILDCSGTTLTHPETGPFSVKLAFALSVSAGMGGFQVGVSLTDPRFKEIVGKSNLAPGVIARCLSLVEDHHMHVAGIREVMAATAHRKGASTVHFVCGLHLPLNDLINVLRSLRQHYDHVVCFFIIPGSEFSSSSLEYYDDQTGKVLMMNEPPVIILERFVESAQELARRINVRLEPLLIESHIADIQVLLPHIASSL